MENLKKKINIENFKNINVHNFKKNTIERIVKTIPAIKKSLFMNIKSWFLLLASIFIISYNDLLNGLLTFFFMLFASHLFHYSCHLALYTNSVHIYHHKHHNYLSHISQMILEFCSILFFFFSKHIYSWLFLNEWVIIFYYLFYTTVHNINYSIFHVNNVHENHHKLLTLNLGPDICDILFQTKFDLEESLENTDHYTWNIFFSLIFIFISKIIWTNATCFEKNIITNVFVFIYTLMATILAILTIYFNFID